ncbi:hypothetical protein STCU_02886 [Strigomonas culicis]|uniref:Uncharacterized protein n=1 Tax=Strigomonas culicis TaxID=28005 RepID=S9UTT1_9TRYP|nr:hypothetical protein STCU_02886 [Strigomonas culicis]|eukprot:EPY32288.1 hypothetical protein STCU_02886 [Strigomonas culicis]
MRFNTRKYARTRDGTHQLPVTNLFLQTRDSYVHGLRYLPLAIRNDMKQILKTGRLSAHQTAITLTETYNCLFSSSARGSCPSYEFLHEVRNLSDEAILGSCTRTNEKYDALIK